MNSFKRIPFQVPDNSTTAFMGLDNSFVKILHLIGKIDEGLENNLPQHTEIGSGVNCLTTWNHYFHYRGIDRVLTLETNVLDLYNEFVPGDKIVWYLPACRGASEIILGIAGLLADEGDIYYSACTGRKPFVKLMRN